MAKSSTSVLNCALDAIGTCDDQPSYREWRKRICQAVGLYIPDLLQVLDGGHCSLPWRSRGQRWGRNCLEGENTRLYSYSILFLFATPSGSANITFLTYEGKISSSLGNGAVVPAHGAYQPQELGCREEETQRYQAITARASSLVLLYRNLGKYTWSRRSMFCVVI